MAGESEHEGAGNESAGWAEESRPAEAPSSFFTFWRCCGCLAFIGIGLTIAVAVGAKWVRDQAFETTPIPVPEVRVDPAEAERIAERLGRELETGELVRMSPEELTIVIQHSLSKVPAFGPQSRFHIAATGEKLLDARLAIHWDENAADVPWFMRGRYSNVSIVGSIEIESGDITAARLASYRFGGFEEGLNVPEEESKQLIEGLRQQAEVNREFRATVDRVKLFRFDGEKIELQLETQ